MTDAIVANAMLVRVWERMEKSAISFSMGARWVPGRSSRLAQPGFLV